MKQMKSLFQRRARDIGLKSASWGFTLIELVMVIIVIVVLAGVLLNYFLYYQEQAERVAMEQTVGSIQSALVLQVGRLMARGREAEIVLLARDNPMKWMQKLPPNYVGEYYDPTPRSVAPGNWMFDLKSRQLIYVPRLTRHFVPGRDGRNWIRFHVRINYESSPVPTAPDRRQELAETIFEPVEPYTWSTS